MWNHTKHELNSYLRHLTVPFSQWLTWIIQEEKKLSCGKINFLESKIYGDNLPPNRVNMHHRSRINDSVVKITGAVSKSGAFTSIFIIVWCFL